MKSTYEFSQHIGPEGDDWDPYGYNDTPAKIAEREAQWKKSLKEDENEKARKQKTVSDMKAMWAAEAADNEKEEDARRAAWQQSVQEQEQKYLEEKKERRHRVAGEEKNDSDRIRDAFARYDADGNGKISKEELRAVLCILGMTEENADCLFDAADANKDQFLDYDEFLGFIGLERKRNGLPGQAKYSPTAGVFWELKQAPEGVTWYDYIQEPDDIEDFLDHVPGYPGRLGACLTAAIVWNELMQIDTSDVVGYFQEDMPEYCQYCNWWSYERPTDHVKLALETTKKATMQIVAGDPWVMLGGAKGNATKDRVTLASAATGGQGCSSLYRLVSDDLQVKFSYSFSSHLYCILSDASHPEWYRQVDARGGDHRANKLCPGGICGFGFDLEFDDGIIAKIDQVQPNMLENSQWFFPNGRHFDGVGKAKVQISAGLMLLKIKYEPGEKYELVFEERLQAGLPPAIGLSFFACPEKGGELSTEIWNVKVNDEVDWDAEETDEDD